jgi:hypothetical protein
MLDKSKCDYFTPALIFFLPGIDSLKINFIQENLLGRLGKERFDSLLWFEIFDDQQQGKINRSIKRISSQQYWDRLIQLNLVDDKFNLDLDLHPKANLIFIADASTYKDTTKLLALTTFINLCKKQLAKKIDLSIILISFGNRLPDGNTANMFWPRIQLTDINQNNLENFGWEDGKTAIANLLMGFTSCNLNEKISGEFTNRGWLIFGASSVIVDLSAMKEYMRFKISEVLIKSLISEPLNPQEQLKVKELIDKHLASESENLFKESLKILDDDFYYKSSNSNIYDIRIKSSSDFRQLIFSPEFEDSFNLLSNSYEHIRGKSFSILGKPAMVQYQDHISLIGKLIDKDYTTQFSGEYLDADQQENLSCGLRTAHFALSYWSRVPHKAPGEFFWEKNLVIPEPVKGGKAIRLLADEDVYYLREQKSILNHFSDSLANIPGILLLALPLVPLLGEYLTIRFVNSKITAYLIALGSIILLSLIPFYYFRGLLNRRKKEYRNSAENRISSTSVRLLSQVMHMYQKVVMERILGIKVDLESLIAGIDRLQSVITRELINSAKAKDEDLNPQTRTIYEMADYQSCDKWIEQSINYLQVEREHGNEFGKTFLANQLFPNLFNRSNIEPAYSLIFKKANSLVDQYFQPDFLHTYQLAFQKGDLREGKLWKWLVEKSTPLGVNPVAKSKNLIFLSIRDSTEDRAALAGAYGKNSEYFPQDAKLIDASLSYEISCFQVFQKL